MNPYLLIIPAALLGRYVLDLIADRLNLRQSGEELPSEFEGVYDVEKYRTSQRYLRDTTSFSTIEDTFQTAAALVFLLAGGMGFVDGLARSAGSGPIVPGLVFAAVLTLASQILRLPFSVYSTFVIEERYGFNKTTPKTFGLDLLKSLLLAALIGGPALAAILWFFDRTGALAWVYCWVAMSAFQCLLIFIAPYVIMPLFNKFEPLEDSELKDSIQDYAQAQNFRMRGVFKMDGSKRSTKSNAFFTGFGRSKRIVLLDTLIDRHTTDELVSIVAHEMGHYRKKHVPQAMFRAILFSGLMFFLLSLFIGNERLFSAFGMEHVSTYGGLFLFGFLYTPLAVVISLMEHAISRRHEYAADEYAVRTAGAPEAMITGLKKLCADNLSNLTPHPFKVALSYSHPPIIERIQAIRRLGAGSAQTPEEQPA